MKNKLSDKNKLNSGTSLQGVDKMTDVINIVRMAQKSGDVVVNINSDGRVTGRSVKAAVSLALKKRISTKIMMTGISISSLVTGILIGLIIDRLVFINPELRDIEDKVLDTVEEKQQVYFTEYETDTLTNLDPLARPVVNLGRDLFLEGKIDEAYTAWWNEILDLPDQTKVVVTGVYTNEKLAFKVYQSLANEFNPILGKLITSTTTQILILVPQVDGEDFESTRTRLSEKLVIPLPKWNSAKILKKRLQN